ncbi:hypothetical protein HCH_06038 [Hahella chejuensis KCTC 2396]|uniref:Uncharacterized protein n=1 Tax=Hahella chejuensis (strain KCTC 2396) TaxID=349521 RepID=Q2S9I6_HAHCH|nr:hypothetical protein HCH_06038 [Hahella chejuensis KCTC 2396]
MPDPVCDLICVYFHGAESLRDDKMRETGPGMPRPCRCKQIEGSYLRIKKACQCSLLAAV